MSSGLWTGDVALDDCEKKCTAIAGGCGCLDYSAGGPSPSPSPGPPPSVARNRLALGLKGTLTAVPAGFSAEWVAVLSTGMLRGMEAWGDTLLANSGKKRFGPYDDPIASSVGWWTDNGAYYHYPRGGKGTSTFGRHF